MPHYTNKKPRFLFRETGSCLQSLHGILLKLLWMIRCVFKESRNLLQLFEKNTPCVRNVKGKNRMSEADAGIRCEDQGERDSKIWGEWECQILETWEHHTGFLCCLGIKAFPGYVYEVVNEAGSKFGSYWWLPVIISNEQFIFSMSSSPHKGMADYTAIS